MSDTLVGQGWDFPVRVRDGRLRLQGGDAKVRQSLWLILVTSPGERPMRPNFGCGLRELVFAANTATLRGRVAQRVRDAVLRFEPRVNLQDVRVETAAGQENCLLIRLDYQVRATNAFYNLVYPFFLAEGPAAPPERLLESFASGS